MIADEYIFTHFKNGWYDISPGDSRRQVFAQAIKQF
jgi:hypothetical protein